jgi:hypothetical protein
MGPCVSGLAQVERGVWLQRYWTRGLWRRQNRSCPIVNPSTDRPHAAAADHRGRDPGYRPVYQRPGAVAQARPSPCPDRSRPAPRQRSPLPPPTDSRSNFSSLFARAFMTMFRASDPAYRSGCAGRLVIRGSRSIVQLRSPCRLRLPHVQPSRAQAFRASFRVRSCQITRRSLGFRHPPHPHDGLGANTLGLGIVAPDNDRPSMTGGCFSLQPLKARS